MPIIKTDFAGTNVKLKVVGDLGVQTSDTSSVELVDGFNHPYYSVGASGTFLRYEFEIDSDTSSVDGLELSGVTMIIKPGGRG